MGWLWGPWLLGMLPWSCGLASGAAVPQFKGAKELSGIRAFHKAFLQLSLLASPSCLAANTIMLLRPEAFYPPSFTQGLF